MRNHRQRYSKSQQGLLSVPKLTFRSGCFRITKNNASFPPQGPNSRARIPSCVRVNGTPHWRTETPHTDAAHSASFGCDSPMNGPFADQRRCGSREIGIRHNSQTQKSLTSDLQSRLIALVSQPPPIGSLAPCATAHRGRILQTAACKPQIRSSGSLPVRRYGPVRLHAPAVTDAPMRRD